MSFNPPPRKNPPKKTYGKASRVRANMFGREMWTEAESAESIARMHLEAQRKREKKRKERIADVVDDVGPRDLRTDAEVDAVTDHLLSLTLSKSSSAQTAAGTTVTTTVEKKIELGASHNGSRRSSTSSLDAGSDKENMPSPPSPEMLRTPPRDPPMRRVSPMLLTPTPDGQMRGVLGEKFGDDAVESPPRKHGLRKRSSMLSSTGAGPSPLRKQTPSKPLSDVTPPPEPIPVWDDDLQHVIVVQPESPPPEPANDDELRSAEREKGARRKKSPSKFAVVIPRGTAPEEETNPNEFEPEPTPQESPASSSEFSELTELSDLSTPEDEGDLAKTNELLNLCNTPRVVDFTAHMDAVGSQAIIKKLGEASYSEVYLQTPTDCDEEPVVLKIIPFGKEEQCEITQIIQEVRITKAMGEIEGYIGFRGYVVLHH